MSNPKKKSVIILRLTQFYEKNPNPSSSEIMKGVAEMWRVNLNKANAVDYVLALDNNNNLVGVYKAVKATDTGIKSGNSTRKIFSVNNISALELMQDFIGHNFSTIFPQGSQNPVRYKNILVELS